MLAIEPMVTAGRHAVRVGDDHWAIYSQDGSLAAHFEFTIAITADGPRILTPWHEAGNGRAASGVATQGQPRSANIQRCACSAIVLCCVAILSAVAAA